jgi:hypothetical protein
MKDGVLTAAIKEAKIDLAIVAAFGRILPQDLLDAPTYGCWNVHASILPRHRGASPIQQCLLDGDEKTGVTLMQMTLGLDEGPMILVDEIEVARHETTTSLSGVSGDPRCKTRGSRAPSSRQRARIFRTTHRKERRTHRAHSTCRGPRAANSSPQPVAEHLDRAVRGVGAVKTDFCGRAARDFRDTGTGTRHKEHAAHRNRLGCPGDKGSPTPREEAHARRRLPPRRGPFVDDRDPAPPPLVS